MKIDQDLIIIGILLVIIGLLLFRKVSGATTTYEYTLPTGVSCTPGFTAVSPLTGGTPTNYICVNGRNKRTPIRVTCPTGWQQSSGATYGKMCRRSVVANPPPPPPPQKTLTVIPPPPPPPENPLSIAGPPQTSTPDMTPAQAAQARAAYLAAGGV